MSLRVSTSSWLKRACSGLMYSNVPMSWPYSVNIVFSVSRWAVALATPKSMIFGTGWPSYSATSTFDGFRSRWMMPFWWACWTAWQTVGHQFQPLRGPGGAAGRSTR